MSPCSCMGRKFPCCTSAQLRLQSFYPSLKLEKPKSFIQVITLSNVSVLSGQWSHPHLSKVITVCGGSSVNMLDSILHHFCHCCCLCVCVCACVHVCVCCGGGARLEVLRSMELKFSFSLMCGVKKKIIPCFHPLSTLPISDFFAFLPDMYMYSSSLSSRLLSLFLSIWTLSLPNSHALVQ